jgi:NTE family protein
LQRVAAGVAVGGRATGLPLEQPREGVRRALVLSGGGARGAYEAGVLRYVFERLPERLGYVPRIDLLCGTSVGAVHACYLAAHADAPPEGVRGLTEIWSRMAFSTVYSFGLGDAVRFGRTLLGFVAGAAVEPGPESGRIHGLLNTAPLEQLVIQEIPWRRLRRNVRHGAVGALCVSVTDIASGRTVVFVDSRERSVPSWTRDQVVVAEATRIGPEHALASAAIPFLFPAVRVGQAWYCDGGLRQLTPLAPALRLGANRVLVIGLRARQDLPEPRAIADERVRQYLSAGFLFGKVLNALLIDRIEYDLAHMRLINRMLRAGVETYGADYLERVNRAIEGERGLGFRDVVDCLIRPSEDLGRVAGRHVKRLRAEGARSFVGGLAFRALARASPEEESDLMSYLLFDGGYASELIELGMRDAAASEDELLRFFQA